MGGDSLVEASEELEQALHLHSCYVIRHYLCSVRGAKPRHYLHTALSLLPDSDAGDAILVLHLAEGVARDAETPSAAPMLSSTTPLETAIGVRAKPLGRAVAAHLHSLGGAALTRDWPIREGHSGSKHKGHASQPHAQDILFTPALLAHASFTPAVVNLLLCHMPGHDGLWNYRRRHHTQLLRAAAAAGDSMASFVACVKELLWVSCLLTAFHKLQPLYVYRTWVLGTLVALLGNATARGEGEGEGALPSLEGVALGWQALDWHGGGFVFAAEKHPLNYNAWHHRRLALSCFLDAHAGAAAQAAAERVSELPCLYIAREFEETLRFLEVNHSDSSAAAYLVYLLPRAARAHAEARRQMHPTPQKQTRQEQQQWDARSSRSTTHAHARATDNDVAVAQVNPRRLWRAALALTQRQLRLYADKGHECFFFLRLGLVAFALEHNTATARRVRGQPEEGEEEGEDFSEFLCASWTVQDELRWVSALVEGYTEKREQQQSLMLSPVLPLRDAWVQCSGGYGFTAYLAARYGCQLLDLLQRRRK